MPVACVSTVSVACVSRFGRNWWLVIADGVKGEEAYCQYWHTCQYWWQMLKIELIADVVKSRGRLPILTHCCKSVPAEGMICWWTSFIQLMFCSINCFSWRGGYSNLLWWSVSGHQPKYLWQPSVHWVMVQMGVKTEGSCQYWHLIALGVTNIWQYFTIFRWPIFDFLPILTPDSVGGWPDHWL